MDSYLESQPTWALKNMVKALSFHKWSNTEEENFRLFTAKLIIKERESY